MLCVGSVALGYNFMSWWLMLFVIFFFYWHFDSLLVTLAQDTC
jgi:hypothetical protein